MGIHVGAGSQQRLVTKRCTAPALYGPYRAMRRFHRSEPLLDALVEEVPASDQACRRRPLQLSSAFHRRLAIVRRRLKSVTSAQECSVLSLTYVTERAMDRAPFSCNAHALPGSEPIATLVHRPGR